MERYNIHERTISSKNILWAQMADLIECRNKQRQSGDNAQMPNSDGDRDDESTVTTRKWRTLLKCRRIQ